MEIILLFHIVNVPRDLYKGCSLAVIQFYFMTSINHRNRLEFPFAMRTKEKFFLSTKPPQKRPAKCLHVPRLHKHSHPEFDRLQEVLRRQHLEQLCPSDSNGCLIVALLLGSLAEREGIIGKCHRTEFFFDR